MFKTLALTSLLQVVLMVRSKALPRADYQLPYGEKLQPKPFKYEYGLDSSNSGGASFKKKETQVRSKMRVTSRVFKCFNQG